MKKTLITIVTLSLLICSNAYGDKQSDFYIGTSTGTMNFVQEWQKQPYTDSTSTGVVQTLYGGVNVSPNISVEGGYMTTGELTGGWKVAGNKRFGAGFMGVKLHYDIDHSFDLYAQLSMAFVALRQTIDSRALDKQIDDWLTIEDDYRGKWKCFCGMLSVGGRYTVLPQLTLKGDVSYMQGSLGDDDLRKRGAGLGGAYALDMRATMLSVGIQYNF